MTISFQFPVKSMITQMTTCFCKNDWEYVSNKEVCSKIHKSVVHYIEAYEIEQLRDKKLKMSFRPWILIE